MNCLLSPGKNARGVQLGEKIIRIYTKTSDSKRLCREVSEQSKSWDEINRIYNKRAKIVSELEKIQEILSTDYKKASCGKVKIINTQNKFDSKFFDSLKVLVGDRFADCR